MDKRGAIAQAAIDRVGCGYIYGATGWVCTEAHLTAQAKQYPDCAEHIFYYGRKYWMGKVCYDCAQLTRRAAREAGYELVSGATSQWNQDIWAQKGTIDALPSGEKAVFLFIRDSKTGRMKHVAVTVGDGFEVEARGHAYGVVKRKIADCSFTHWARLRDIDGEASTETPTEAGLPTLKKGLKGQDVKRMQNLLIAAGCPLPKYGADGVFGAETMAAVLTFQAREKLSVDGVVGTSTWAALLAGSQEGSEPGEEGEPGEEARYTVHIPDLDLTAAQELAAKYPGATIAEQGGA